MRAMPVPPITALLWEWWDESAMPSTIDETAPYPYSITSAERVGAWGSSYDTHAKRGSALARSAS